ncbi:NUDIX hydrolase domain-like protein [Phascolomyces articulosus]|uniref:NUDIX hydrolase domain-like protein n=1 Tax=Phascolomyces articulosus TaxID=60185 RepID=A0AAD5K4F9_9FUNG|nr:NUDIX hydrolase domain-like protein [Phascolomyces articulosus]
MTSTMAVKNTSVAGSVQSLSRKPTEPLYLFVKKPRLHNAWQFPQGGMDPGETMSQAALRELEEECGKDIKVQLLDQEPLFTYQYEFPAEFVRHKKSNFIGAKVEFMRAEWISGQCQPDGQEIVDFAWLSRHEIDDYIFNPEYKNLIEKYIK